MLRWAQRVGGVALDIDIEILFDNATSAQSNVWAQDLKEDLIQAVPSAELSTKRERPDSQDFGGTLVLALGTPVAIIAAKAISTWLRRNSGATITIKASGEVIARNLDSSDAAKIAEAIARAKRPTGS